MSGITFAILFLAMTLYLHSIKQDATADDGLPRLNFAVGFVIWACLFGGAVLCALEGLL